MMKKSINLASLGCIMLLLILLPACREIQSGSGNLQTLKLNHTDFNRLEIRSAFYTEIRQADNYSVEITMDDNAFDYLEVSKLGDTLKIGLRTFHVFKSPTLQAVITMPEIRSLELSGASKGIVSGFVTSKSLELGASGASHLELAGITCGDLEITLSGASKLKGDIHSADAEIQLSGASQVQLDGSAGDLTLDASGFSHTDLADFPVENADVSLSGASTCNINTAGRLDADLSGASKLVYLGNPAMGKINTSDASSIMSQ